MENTRVETFLQYILATKGLSQRTAEIYGNALKDLSAFCSSVDEGLTWETLDVDVIRRWMAATMERGCSPRTVKQQLSGVSSFYRYMLLSGYIKVDPTQKIQPPKAPKTLPTFLKRSEVDKLLHHMKFPDDYMGVRDRTIVAILCHTGIRASEILGLRLSDIDLSNCTLKVTGKRNKQRIVPFNGELQEILAGYLPERQRYIDSASGGTQVDNCALLLNSRRNPLTYAELRVIVRDALGNVTTQQKRSPHVLRHTFATIMLDNGGDLEAIQQLLGHESVATTEIYTHTSFAELRAQYAQAHPHSKD